VIVAVLGLGAMGLPMAKRLVGAGFEVRGFDVAEAPLEKVVAAGGHRAGSPAEAANGAHALLVMTATGAQAEAALFGPEGAAAFAHAGAVVVLCCTQSPASTKALAEKIEAAGLLALDAPVSGGVPGAAAGRLTVMASGSEGAFAAAKPLLDRLAGRVYDLGREPGLGSTMKTVNQLVAGAHIAVAAEALALAARAGVDPALAKDVLMAGAGGSWILGNRGPRMLEREPEVHSAVEIFVKDLGLVDDLARSLRQPAPLAAAALQMFLAASAMGNGRADDSQVVRVYETLSGASVRR
jgi:3-hydroxyisobutyrate dehydrogenase